MDPDALATEIRLATGLPLEAPELLRQGRATTLRYQVASGSAAGGRQSVIVKRADPTSETFRREAAALRVLPGCGTDTARVPRLLYDLAPTGVLVMQDAPGVLLSDRPVGDSEQAPTDLLRVARALGELHAAARDARDQLEEVGGQPAHHAQAETLRRSLPAVREFMSAAGVAVDDALERALSLLADAIHADTAHTTITLGDMAPSNVLIGADAVTFIDLEFCGVRHPFYDAMFWRCIVPFAPHVSDAMEHHYREGLARGGWHFEDAVFQTQMSRLATHRLFWMLSWNMRALFTRDRPVAPGGPGLRAVLLHHLAELLRLYARAALDDALTRAVEDCLATLRTRWNAQPADVVGGAPAIFHITTQHAWQSARDQGIYAPPSLQTEGFIHFSTESQLLPTAQRFYAGRRDLLVLVSNAYAHPALRFEAPRQQAGEAPGALFPHLHAALPMAAVTRVETLQPEPDGSFRREAVDASFGAS